MYKINFFAFFLCIWLHFLLNDAIAQYSFNGFLRNEVGLITNKNPNLLFARNILQLEPAYRSTNLTLKSSVQIRQNLMNGNQFKPNFRIREAYFEKIWSQSEVQIGRQMIVWGRSDATQINDIITPFDISEFLTQDFADLRLGVSAINFSYFRTSDKFQFIVLPFFENNRMYSRGSIWDPLPSSGNINESSDIFFRPSEKPSFKVQNIQYALRYENRSSLNLDFDISVFHGFNKVPYLSKQVVQSPFSQQLVLLTNHKYELSTILMSSAEYRITPTVASVFEISYWMQRQFDVLPPTLRDPTTPPLEALRDIQIYNERSFLASSPFIQSMIGFKSTISNITYSLQYVTELITDHKNDMQQDQFFHFFSFLANWTSDNNNWQIRFLSRYQLNGKDFWIKPDINYAISDGFRASIGLHQFGGPTPTEFYGHLSFNSYKLNSFSYLKLTSYW